MSDDPSAREEGFYWVELGQNPPEIAYWSAPSGSSPVTQPIIGTLRPHRMERNQ